MAKIFLSIPIMDKPEFKMIFSVYKAILSCPEHQVRIFANENDSLISRVRNVHLSLFLNEYKDCDYFISIDSDLEILNSFKQNNIFSKLIDQNKEFVGGLYPLKQYESEPKCASIPIGIPREKIPFDQGVIPMQWLSSGCWCLTRSAVQKMADAYPELDYVGDDNVSGQTIHGLCIPDIFEVGEEGKKFKKYLSEDWAFCRRWKDIGGEIWADTSIILNHLGKIPYCLWNVKTEERKVEKEPEQQPPLNMKSAEEMQEWVDGVKEMKEKINAPIDLPAPGYNLD